MPYRSFLKQYILIGLASFCVGNAQAVPDDAAILEASAAARARDINTLDRLASLQGNHILDEYIQYWRLSLRLSMLDMKVNEAIEGFLRRNAGTVLAQRLREEWLRRLAKLDERALFEREYAVLEKPEADLQCYALQPKASTGNSAALDQLEPFWLQVLNYPDTCEAALQSLVIYKRKNLEDVIARARRLVENRQFTTARRTLLWVADVLPFDNYALDQALSNPNTFLRKRAAKLSDSRGGQEIIVFALARRAREDHLAAHESLAQLGTKKLTAAQRAYVYGMLAWMAAKGHDEEALGWYRNARSAVMSEEQYAWWMRVALLSGNWTNVSEAYQALPANMQTQSVWSYWYARALISQGRREEALPLLQKNAGQISFYGLLSSEALGKTLAWSAPATPPTSQAIAEIGSRPAIGRALALFKLGLRTEGLREWNWTLRDADDRTLIAAAEYARRAGLYDRAIYAAERTQSEHDYSLRYLAPFYEVFDREAKRNQLSLPWVYGLVRQESRFVPAIQSSVGAAGLMQIMPATGTYIAHKIGLAEYRPSMLVQVDTNVMLGAAYLRYVVDRLDNSWVLASAAYNAGPGRAQRWRKREGQEGAIYAETIPFDETRDYVKKVLTNAAMYAVLLEGKSASLTELLGTIPPQY